jgi:hypothetical protein
LLYWGPWPFPDFDVAANKSVFPPVVAGGGPYQRCLKDTSQANRELYESDVSVHARES